jgi:hypothetical protein
MTLDANVPHRTGPSAPRKRAGCLGCFVRSLGILLAFFVVGCVVVMAIALVFTPWSYKLGGHYHLFPFWGGWGRVNSSSAGGEYVMYTWLGPGRGSQYSGNTHLTGRAWICTPAGETLDMRSGADLPRGFYGVDTIDKPLHVYLYYRGGFFGSFRTDRRPYLDFQGRWADRALILDDRTTISQAFLPDGTVYRDKKSRPKSGEDLTIALNEGSYWDFKAACAAMKKK